MASTMASIRNAIPLPSLVVAGLVLLAVYLFYYMPVRTHKTMVHNTSGQLLTISLYIICAGVKSYSNMVENNQCVPGSIAGFLQGIFPSSMVGDCGVAVKAENMANATYGLNFMAVALWAAATWFLAIIMKRAWLAVTAHVFAFAVAHFIASHPWVPPGHELNYMFWMLAAVLSVDLYVNWRG